VKRLYGTNFDVGGHPTLFLRGFAQFGSAEVEYRSGNRDVANRN
jgi:hypothetical protein